MRKAIVDSAGLVINVIEVESGANWTPPADCTAVDAPDSVSPSFTYASGSFTAPENEAVANVRKDAWAAASTTAAKFDVLADLLDLKADV
jgi:hypothetical protein